MKLSAAPPRCLADLRVRRGPATAVTLVELVAVLAVIACLVAVGSLAMVAYYDQKAREEEQASLGVLAEAIRKSVTVDLLIPSQAEFAVQASRFSGIAVPLVRTNARGNPRYLLIDPGITNCGFDVPFSQTANPMAGAGAGALSHLRLMVLSSVGRPYTEGLPAAPGGKPTAAVFDGLWAAPQGTLPAGVDWAGDPQDLCIRRLQLLDSLYMVSLSHAECEGRYTNGKVRFPGMVTFAAPPGAPFPSARWCLRGTTLVLSNAADQSLLSEIITGPVSFTYEKGYWRRGMSDLMTASGSLSKITGADFEAAIQAFLAASTSTTTNPGNITTASNIVNAMIGYITNGALGPSSGTRSAMDDYLFKASNPVGLRTALLEYTDLPSGQLNKP